jgi:hypothetical protein
VRKVEVVDGPGRYAQTFRHLLFGEDGFVHPHIVTDTVLANPK